MGLMGMIDPPRPRPGTPFQVRRAIRTVMITGDHVVTASAIARQMGILHSDDEAITGGVGRHERRGAARGDRRVLGLRPGHPGGQDPHRQGLAGRRADRLHDRGRRQRRARPSRRRTSAAPWGSPAPTWPRARRTWS